MATRNDNMIAFVVILLLSLLAIPALLLFIEPSHGTEIPPRFWPSMAVATTLAFCGPAIAIEAVYGGRFAAKEALASLLTTKRQVAFLAMATAYLLSIDYLGFLAASIVMLPLTMFFFGLRRRVFGVIVSVAFVATVFLLFHKVFKISFPAGRLF